MGGTPKLDRIDINILSTLQTQGNITNVNLAEAVSLSPSPCLQRVKRLEKAGYIQNSRAVINLKKLTDHVARLYRGHTSGSPTQGFRQVRERDPPNMTMWSNAISSAEDMITF